MILAEVAAPVALADVAVAALALLVFLAGVVWKGFLGAIFRRVPVVGATIANAVDGAINWAENLLLNWLSELTRAIGATLYAMVMWPWRVAQSAVNAVARTMAQANAAVNLAHSLFGQAEAVAQNDANIVDSYAIQLYHAAVAAAQNDANIVDSYAIQLYHAAVAAAQADADEVTSYAQQLYNAAVGHADRVAGQVQAHLDALSQAVNQGLTAADQQAANDLRQAIAQAQAAAAAAQAAAITAAGTIAQSVTGDALGAIDQAAKGAVIGPWQALLPDLGTITAHLPAATVQALGLPQVLTDPVPATVPGILSLVVPAIAAVGAEVARCTVPMCENLGPLSNLYGDLATGALWAALIALVAEAVTDPAGAADAITADLGGLVDGLAGTIGALFGATVGAGQ